MSIFTLDGQMLLGQRSLAQKGVRADPGQHLSKNNQAQKRSSGRPLSGKNSRDGIDLDLACLVDHSPPGSQNLPGPPIVDQAGLLIHAQQDLARQQGA